MEYAGIGRLYMSVYCNVYMRIKLFCLPTYIHTVFKLVSTRLRCWYKESELKIKIAFEGCKCCVINKRNINAYFILAEYYMGTYIEGRY